MALETRFDNQVVIVTGATRGVGRAMVQAFAGAGAKVAFSARREAPVREFEADLRAQGHDVLGVPADVAVHADCERLVAAAVQRWGTVDILINNVGISGAYKLVTELSLEEFDTAMKANLYSAYACIHFAARHMVAQKRGAIVNIGSMTGKRPMPTRTAYATSKMALIGLTRTVAVELAPYNVRCNTISPGPIAGERFEEVLDLTSAAREVTRESVREGFLNISPMRAMIEEADIVNMAMYLASDLARHMTGQEINVTAGVVMY